MNHRQVSVLLALLVCLAGCSHEDASQDLTDAVTWLESEAHRMIRASQREMSDGTLAFPPQVGIHYEAFWLRDYEYTLEGSIDSYSERELLASARLFISSIDSSGAGVDCIRFDGTPIYKPGLGTMGEHPVTDGGPFTVGVAWYTFQKTQDGEFLVNSLDNLVKTMDAVPRTPETGLVFIDPTKEHDRCPYGFTDTVRKQGDVLFSSLLFVRAARQLTELLESAGRTSEATRFAHEADRVVDNIRHVFWDADTGLFRAATIQCREHDIWGSAFAVYLGVADEDQSNKIAQYFKTHYADIVQHGQVRHLPGGVYWEIARERDHYQNGAFWATPVGWFVYTLDLVDPHLADRTVIDMVDDFRQHGVHEWMFEEQRTLPGYLASAALPLEGIRLMLSRRSEAPIRNSD